MTSSAAIVEADMKAEAMAGEEAQEAKGKQAAAELDALRREVAAMRDKLTAEERGHAIELELAKALTVDAEAARLLVEQALEGGAKDARAAVAQVRQKRPMLFRGLPAQPGATLSPRQAGGGVSDIERAQQAAQASGDRKALMRYLRLRRTAG